MTLAQDVCPHHVIHDSCAVVVLILFDSPLCTLHRLSHLPFHSPLFAPADLLITTPRPLIEILAQRKFIAEVQGTSGKASTTRSSDEGLY